MLAPVTRLIIELREDVRFDDGAWHPVDEAMRAQVDALVGGCGSPTRLFSRPAAAIDRDRIAVQAKDVPDLNLFYVVDGELATLLQQPLVAQVSELDCPGPAAPLGDLGPSVAVVRCDATASLAEAIDRGGGPLELGDVLVVPYAPVAPITWAAAEIHARRGVSVIVLAGAAPPAFVRHVVTVAGRELARTARAAAAADRPRRVRIRVDSVELTAGVEIGSSEIYLEGWVDDGERHPFRVPEKGARAGVRTGRPVALDAVIYESEHPTREDMILHIEVWEEDLGRDSLVDPDDLLAIHQRKLKAGERWDEGRHAAVRISNERATCVLGYTIDLL
jgi:hypothetical protein